MAILIPEELDGLFSDLAGAAFPSATSKPVVEFQHPLFLYLKCGAPADGLFNEEEKIILLADDLPRDWVASCFVHESTHWLQAERANWRLQDVVKHRYDVYEMEYEAFKNQINYLQVNNVIVPSNRVDIKNLTEEELCTFIEEAYCDVAQNILRIYQEKRRMEGLV